MLTKGLVTIVVGIFFAWGPYAVAAAADKNIGLAAPAVSADELAQIRGGMTIPRLKEIVVVGLRSDEAVESVIPELSGIVVLAGVPEAASGISEALVTTAGGVRGGISEALVTTAGGIRETIGQIAAGVRTARSAALQQGRVLLDSD